MCITAVPLSSAENKLRKEKERIYLFLGNRILKQHQMRQLSKSTQRIKIRQLGEVIRSQNERRQIR